MSNPRISICVPTHNMENREFFLDRLKLSLEKQTFTDFELVITEEGKMAKNTNAAIKKAKGEIVKILFMDDYLYDENALQHLVDNWKGGWAVSGCVHDNGGIYGPHFPKWNDNMRNGINTIGSPSVLAFENSDTPPLFDEELSWLLDCDLYQRLYGKYGRPTVINYIDVAIGIHPGQTTNLMSDAEKRSEALYLDQKYGTY